MTFDSARPRYKLPFDGKDYELTGELSVIEAIETAMQRGILDIAVNIVGMGLTDTAKLLTTILNACNHSFTHKTVAAAIFNMGLGSKAFATLQLHLYSFIAIILQPPDSREKKAQEMAAMLNHSRGESTSSSA